MSVVRLAASAEFTLTPSPLCKAGPSRSAWHVAGSSGSIPGLSITEQQSLALVIYTQKAVTKMALGKLEKCSQVSKSAVAWK